MAAFQIIFTPASSAEITRLPTPLQVEVLREFDVLTADFLEKHPDRFGTVRCPDRTLYRYRAGDYRIYFEKTDKGLVIHRVLHKNSLKDFAFRSQLPLSEDEVLGENPKFWELINSPGSKNE
ncbi:MAG: type II toxin-antitoxin system RelE/ParE family toxin [Verrucomicrobia bacterium]|nr:type II toxin-antitoxin system RelE/ParE family toxin [Verrucomicrobiota bacterium]